MLVGNPDLKPETAISYELGTAYEGERWGAGVTAFDNQIEQMIQAESWKIKPGAPVLTYQNVAEARLRGVEFMPWVALTERLDLTANYTFVRPKTKPPIWICCKPPSSHRQSDAGLAMAGEPQCLHPLSIHGQSVSVCCLRQCQSEE